MNPTTPVQPVANTQSPQGVTAVAPTPGAAAPTLPTPGAFKAPPAPLQNPSINPQSSATAQTIADFYQIPRTTAETVNQTQSQGNVAEQGFKAGQYEAGVQEQNLKDQLDPSKYTIKQDPKSQYGLSITNSLGQQVDLGTYINLTGANPAEVLKTSADPGAQKFVAAYNNFESLMQTKIGADHGDQQAQAQLNDFYEANPGLQNMSLQQITDAFMGQYGQYFGQPQQNQAAPKGVTPTFTSANNPVTTSPYYNQNFQTEFQNNPFQQQGSSSVGSMLSQLQQQQSGG